MLKQVEKIWTYGHLSNEVTELETRNRELARTIAAEAIVLLENNGCLPLKHGARVAMFGTGVTNTVKGGSGSGEVNERYSVSIYEGMKNAGCNITTHDVLERYQNKATMARKEYEEKMLKYAGFINFKVVNMANMDQGYHEAPFGLLTDADYRAADICIYVVSRISGEGADRKPEKGDYYLSDEENANIHWCAKHYSDVVLVFNAGGPVDISSCDDISFGAILNIGMLGEEGGNAFADVVTGKVSPSGHLTGTWAVHYEDIPNSETYSSVNGTPESDDYCEDIYVGYRYCTRFGVKPRFCFGQGLSYTTFSLDAKIRAEEELKVITTVTNTGKFSGMCVPQVYLSAPETTLKQPGCILIGYSKTKNILPGETVSVEITIPYHYMASFNDQSGAEVMEAGVYGIYLGWSVEDKWLVGGFELAEDVCLTQRKHICPEKRPIVKLTPGARKPSEIIPEDKLITVDPTWIKAEQITKKHNPMDDYTVEAKEIVGSLSHKELAYLLTGEGCADMVLPVPHDVIVPGATGNTTTKMHHKGLCSFACCDGPAGLRFMRTSVVKPGADRIRIVEPAIDMLHFMPKLVRMLGNSKITDGQPLYLYATAFPTGTALAQTWNEELVQRMGEAVGDEMREYGVTVWLAPGMNIHRNPLCGRNYEYYSEDPLLTGKIGAAMVRGVQSRKGCYATIKHFFCNNQEDQRQWTTANVGERALREIYLRGFGMAVKEGGSRALMSSYNMINGIWSGVCKDALTTVLREEWGFDGYVVTDWDGSHEGLEAERSIDAGITMLMAGDEKQRKAITKALDNGTLSEEIARDRAIKNVQIMLLHQALMEADK